MGIQGTRGTMGTQGIVVVKEKAREIILYGMGIGLEVLYFRDSLHEEPTYFCYKPLAIWSHTRTGKDIISSM